MSKTSMIGMDFKDGEARLWKDDETGAISLSVDDPFDGFTPKQIIRLKDFLIHAVGFANLEKPKKMKCPMHNKTTCACG